MEIHLKDICSYVLLWLALFKIVLGFFTPLPIK